MSIGGLMTTSISGMDAQAQMLATISKNVANSNTVGYKMDSAQFSTLIDKSPAGIFESGGVNFSARSSVEQQGLLEATQSPTDLAVQGNGFFVVQDSGGLTALTRAGSFVPDSSGFLVNTAGWRVMGYSAAQSGQSPVANGVAGLSPISVNNVGLQATASTAGVMTANFPADNSINLGPTPSTNSPTSQYDVKTSLIAFGNLGNQVTLDVYGAKTAAGSWEISAFNRSDAAAGGGFPYTSGPLASMTINFDSTSGLPLTGSPTNLSVPVPNGSTVSLDLSKSTQLSAGFSVESAKINGNAPSSLDHISVSGTGGVSEVYANGAQKSIFQIPLATVQSPDNLIEMPGNTYAVSSRSGDMSLGIPGTAGVGTLASNELEQSTVDVAAELTKMIQSQRDYTANSKVFQTGANIIDVALNLVR